MKIYLLRHAKALKRSRWERPDELRPLSRLGRRQALGLAGRLAGEPIDQIVSSPHRRCRESVEPLADVRRLRVELDGRLAEGQRVAKALELLASLGDRRALLCSHGDLIPGLLCELEERGAEIVGDLRCEKGALWVIEGELDRGLRATYLPPPIPGKDADDDRGVVRQLRAAVLDLGSTSFHLLVANASSDGELEPIASERAMLRLGAVIQQSGSIPEAICTRALESARKLARVAQRHGAERILPVATAALREAGNGAQLAEQISGAVGAPVRVLSGEEEARLMFAAFRHRERAASDVRLGLDLGGGSLELAIGDETAIAWEATLALGAARVHAQIVHSDPMRAREVRALQALVRSQLEPHLAAIHRQVPTRCTATGGSVRALMRLAAARRGGRKRSSESPAELSLRELRELREELVSADHERRLRMPGISRQRADLLPCAAVVVECVADALGFERLQVSDWGLREGVLLEAVGLACSAR